MLRYLTAGESHGRCLTAIIEGIPSNVPIDIDEINKTLRQRQIGYGRGNRMNIEEDNIEILSGVRNGKTLGSPICIKIDNKDWENNKEVMDILNVKKNIPITVPRPGHADLSGILKYNQSDIRNIMERASARETAIRTAVGSVAQQLLKQFNIHAIGHVIKIGKITSHEKFNESENCIQRIEASILRCIDENAENEMIKLIDEAKETCDTLGGIIEIVVTGVPIGLGSCMHWDRKLDANIAYELMSIQGIKGVEFGLGFQFADKFGSEVHDEISYEDNKFCRNSNNAGGIEGGMSNGEPIIIRAAMKPIPTLVKPLRSVNICSKEQVNASVVRSDICAVPAVSVIAQSMVAFEIAKALIEKCGGDSLEEVRHNYNWCIKKS